MASANINDVWFHATASVPGRQHLQLLEAIGRSASLSVRLKRVGLTAFALAEYDGILKVWGYGSNDKATWHRLTTAGQDLQIIVTISDVGMEWARGSASSVTFDDLKGWRWICMLYEFSTDADSGSGLVSATLSVN